MRAVDVIQRKRDGLELSREEISFFVEGYTRGRIPDYQASALAMAIFFKGMTAGETVGLAEAMMGTGEVLDLSDLPGPKADKHSTGGVGDKTSLILAPLAAACGVYVPMISGRGLGHTGGTLDKLESIPGFRVNLSLTEFRAVLRKARLGLIGQTPEIAPADRKLYALRDVTATVESLPLIAASIMSKKMAEGIDALILDVKTGDGAFMKTLPESKGLAETMVAIGRGLGKKVAALITDMEQPLGHAVGNALEVAECVETLKGRGPKDLESLSLELAGWMLTLGGLVPTMEAARARVRDALGSGAGLRKFQEIVELQGGDPRVCDDGSRLPRAREQVDLKAEADGRVVRIGCRAVGHAAMLLGAGRETVDSAIDPAVGLVLHKKVGDLVIKDEPLLTLHVNDRGRLDEAQHRLREAIRVAPEAPPRAPLIHAVLD
ncbi:MAG TPA: thymidine phosphorylase [Vicinamibacteria bacterium]|jgi:pyrimidine-nucleoside phosphorylase|nr:thymidine phosphorylase [Vicinamibacteria bacterium]